MFSSFKTNSPDIPILFGIVCFREKYWKTQSFRDLLKSYYKTTNNHQLYISIYDNTDSLNWINFNMCPSYQNVMIDYYHDSSNSGISAAFNYFGDQSKKMGTEWIVFLDQDTGLPIDFYSKYLQAISISKENIAFPRIYANKNLISPSQYKLYRTSKLENLSGRLLLKNVTAINSGLMIKTNFFFENKGYNKDLRIDFCDHEFIERLNNRNIFAYIIDVNLNQEFSFHINNKEKSLQRYKLYVNDLKVYKKNKNKFIFFLRVDLPHLLKEIYRNKSLKFLTIRFNV